MEAWAHEAAFAPNLGDLGNLRVLGMWEKLQMVNAEGLFRTGVYRRRLPARRRSHSAEAARS